MKALVKYAPGAGNVEIRDVDEPLGLGIPQRLGRCLYQIDIETFEAAIGPLQTERLVIARCADAELPAFLHGIEARGRRILRKRGRSNDEKESGDAVLQHDRALYPADGVGGKGEGSEAMDVGCSFGGSNPANG